MNGSVMFSPDGAKSKPAAAGPQDGWKNVVSSCRDDALSMQKDPELIYATNSFK